MSQNDYTNKPMVISFDGEVFDDIEFEFIDDMGWGGCPATINGKLFMFGGMNGYTKVSLTRKNLNL